MKWFLAFLFFVSTSVAIPVISGHVDSLASEHVKPLTTECSTKCTSSSKPWSAKCEPTFKKGLCTSCAQCSSTDPDTDGLDEPPEDSGDEEVVGSPAAKFTQVGTGACRIADDKKDYGTKNVDYTMTKMDCDGCKAACAADGACKAYECYAGKNKCELWSSVPTFGGGNPPFECWQKDEVAAASPCDEMTRRLELSGGWKVGFGFEKCSRMTPDSCENYYEAVSDKGGVKKIRLCEFKDNGKHEIWGKKCLQGEILEC